MDFTDTEHSIAALVFQGVDQHDPTACCDTEILTALNAWSTRGERLGPAVDVFQRPATQYFAISYDGQSSGYWPDEAQNWLSETLVREFLFRDGICILETFEPRFYDVRYKLEALEGNEYLLVCPFATASGDVGGIVVVCVNHHLAPVFHRRQRLVP